MRFFSLLLLCLGAVTYCSAYYQFQHTLVPTSAEKQSTVVASKRVTVGRSDEQTFNKVARTRELHNCVLPGCRLMGEVLNINQRNVTVYDPKTFKKQSRIITTPGGKKFSMRHVQFSHAPSGGVLLHEEITNRWYMIYQFESPNPGTMYRLWLRLVNDTQISTRLNIPINMQPFSGLWKPRVAIQTPSNTMLGAEGLPPDGRYMEDLSCMQDRKNDECLVDVSPNTFYDVMNFMRYFVRPPEDLKKEDKLEMSPLEAIPGFKPYRYGYLYELQLGLNEHDRVLDEVSKLYAMGRVGAHGVAVMQDGYTVYMTGGNGGLYRFVDEVGSFRNGALSAAKITLRDAKRPSVKLTPGMIFDVEWKLLGTGDSDSLEQFVSSASDTKFSDMFAYKDPSGGSCAKGFDLAIVGNTTECLQVKNEGLAAILEPARLGAINGATMNIFKFSQMVTKLDSYEFYLGVQSVDSGYIDLTSGKSTINIEDNMCGCVFKVTTDKDYSAKSMEVMICGEEQELTSAEKTCSTESIANPRALTYAHRFDQILVGEDSPYHSNNFIWALDPETHQHVRIFHASRQGRITSLSWLQDVIGGNNYIGVTIADPFDVLGWMSYFGSFELGYQDSMAFSDVAVPYDIGPKNLPIGFGRVTSGETFSFSGFVEIIRTGMRLGSPKRGNVLIGELLDAKFKSVDEYNFGPVEPRRIEENEVSHRLGFTSIINSCGELYSITATNSLPGMSYVVPLQTSKKQLVAESASIIDWSAWGGLWRSGGGVVSPWNTHFSGEIHEPDAADFLGYQCLTGFSSCFKSQSEESFYESIRFIRYHGVYVENMKNKFEAISDNFNPYNFGYAYEIKINKEGCVNPQKLYTLGRFSHGGISIMPDMKTVYMTDFTKGRAVGGGFYRFVADKAKDLSSGTLYAAKMGRVPGSNSKFNVEWIKLGHATDSELRKMAKKVRFADIFDHIPSSRSCRLKQINVKSQTMCLQVRKGMEKHAAFLETRRFAALQGATIEFANTRGITFDAFSARLYFTFSSISTRDRVMLQDDIEGSSNDLKFAAQPCGCIYAMSLTTAYEAFSMDRHYCGTNHHGTVRDNTCSVEHIAGGTDLAHIPDNGQLLVAEDSCDASTSTMSCGHVNNALWSLAVDTSPELTRIMTAAKASAISSPSWNPNLLGNSYLTAVVNEIYDDLYKVRDSVEPAALFGYLGPVKTTKNNGETKDPVCYNNRVRGDQCLTT